MRRRVIAVAAVVVVAAAAFGLYWFQPWKLVVDERVDDALSTPEPVATAAPTASEPPATSEPPEPAGPVLLAEGEFITHEHATSGDVRLIENPDGSYQLELIDLDTSNGPDLRVWLTDQPVIEGQAGWHVFDDGEWVELGKLKGNQGDQVYEVPGDVDPANFSSVSIWCKRFSVSFGAAELTP